METFNYYLGELGDAHSTAAQLSIAIVVTIGLLMCVLSAVFPLTSQEPDFEADCAPWPLADAASAESRWDGDRATGGGMHLVGAPNSVVMGPE